MSGFLDFHLEPMAKAVKSHINDTNDSLNKLRFYQNYMVTLFYSNIQHKENLPALRKRLDNQMEKYISNDTLCYLAEVVLKNYIFKFGKNKIIPSNTRS